VQIIIPKIFCYLPNLFVLIKEIFTAANPLILLPLKIASFK